MDEILADFVAEASIGLDEFEADLARLCANGADLEALNRALRAMHKIKGACGFLKLARIEALTHACEGGLGRLRDGRADGDILAMLAHSATHLRALLTAIAGNGGEPAGDDAALLDALGYAPNALDWADELSRARARLTSIVGAAPATPFATLNAIAAQGAAALDLPARAPLETAWRSLPALVEDLAASLGKPMQLTLSGGDIEVDRASLGLIKEILRHLARNCAAHGVEAPAERRALGKGEAGTISVQATRDGDQIRILVADDGRGLDLTRVRHRAIAMGLCFASEAARMAPEALLPLIFAPGFSTAERVTPQSGRGIGLDAVRVALDALGAAIAVSSVPGSGTAFTLHIPLERQPKAADTPPSPVETAATSVNAA